VIALDPKHAESYNYIGYMYAEKGTNLSEAIQLIQQALALEPENGYFIDSLGWAYYQQGRYQEALRELKRAVSLAKEDPVLYEHLGDAYLKNNLTNEALEAWEKSLKVDPDGPTANQVRTKIQQMRESMSRAKGAPPKAEQK
jgi:tetratricopeptide (TPR) repeat protein